MGMAVSGTGNGDSCYGSCNSSIWSKCDSGDGIPSGSCGECGSLLPRAVLSLAPLPSAVANHKEKPKAHATMAETAHGVRPPVRARCCTPSAGNQHGVGCGRGRGGGRGATT